MNKLNVFNTYWCPWKYPSNWPSNFRVFFRQFKWAYQRITKGYCDFDYWDWDTWMSQLIAQSLKELADKTHGYPGTDQFPTYESWKDYLYNIVNLLEFSLRDDLPNEYEEAWMKKWEEKDFDIINREDTPEEKEITDKYLAIENNNAILKKEAQDKALKLLIPIWNQCWD